MKVPFINQEEVDSVIKKIDNIDKTIQKEDSEIMTTSVDKNHCNIKTGEVPYRFVILLSYCLLTFSNGMQWVTFSPISDNMILHYNKSSVAIDFFSLVYMIVYPFVNFPSSYILDKVSIRLGLFIASLGTIIAGGFKLLINYNFFYAYVGQTFAALVQPLILNSCSKISSIWFRPNIRILITSIACLSNVIGVSIGYFLPGFIFDDNLNKDSFLSSMKVYLLISFLISLIFCIPSLFLIKNKPSIPSSISQQDIEEKNFKESLQILIKDKNFIYLTINFTFIIGFYNLYGTKITQIFTQYKNITFHQTSIISSSSNVIGVISAIIFSLFLDKYKTYKKTFIFLNLTCFICQTALSILPELFEEYSYYIFLILFNINQICVVSIYSISLDYVVELTYPIGESISGGIILTASQISGICSILLVDLIMRNNDLPRCFPNLFCCLLILVALVSLIFVKDNLKRNKKEEEK